MSSTWTSSLLLMMIPAFQYCLCPRVKSKLNIFPPSPSPSGAHSYFLGTISAASILGANNEVTASHV